MTPPPPTAPTAAEQAFSDAVYDVLAQIGHGDPPATSFLDDINRLAATLMAAMRAEALEEAAKRCEAVAWSGEYPEPNYFGCGALVSAEKVRALVSK